MTEGRRSLDGAEAMGVMKRIYGWRMAGLPIAQSIQILAGMIDETDLEARVRLRAEARLLREERLAIQEEGCGGILPPPTVTKPGAPMPDLESGRPSSELPRRGADGWYRVGQTFYRLGAGPHPHWFDRPAAEPLPAGKLTQGRLFT